MPKASPGEGNYDSAPEVELSCETSGAEIYFTTDGGDPEVGTPYTEPITISGNTTLKAIAVKDGMNKSPVLTAVYTIGPLPQPGHITMTTGKTTVSFILAGSGPATIDWDNGESPEDITLTPSGKYYSRPGLPADVKTIRMETTEGTITWLDCSYTDLESLDVSHNTALKKLQCQETGLTALDVTNNTALTYLDCFTNGLTTLDVSGNTALTELKCHDNTGLTILDLPNSTVLTTLVCYRTGITKLDVSGNPALTWLTCANTGIKTLDVANNTKLTFLECGYTGIKALDVTNNTALESLHCDFSQLSAEALNTLFGTLHSNDTGSGYNKAIRYTGNPGYAACDRTIAEAKGWKIFE